MSNATVAPSKPYTAIVYFHGIGRQRRYEEISRLIDGLDKYSFYSSSDRKVQLRRQKNVIEPGRGPSSDDVEYISARRIIYTKGKPPTRGGLIRIYEAYWSHAPAGGYSGLRVLFWIVARLINPYRGLFQVWRSQPRLKLAQLYRMQHEPRDPGTVGPYVRLETIYRDFENWPARRLYPRGSFRQFKRYLKNRCESQILDETMFLAKRWRREFALSQISLILFAITIVIALINLGGWFWIAIAGVRAWEIEHTAIQFLTDDFVRLAAYMVFGCGSVYLLVRTLNFFSMHVSDIMFWTTSDEKDRRFQKRQDILRATDLLLRHVLEDQGCERLVIVGHSLGSAIAYETLLHLGRARIARSGVINMPISLASLDKITDFITLGSPIEIIASLFEMEPSKFHRYNRIAEDRRGCTDDVPFLGGKGVRWVNVSDPADLISRPIYSVRGRLPNNLAIYEWKTASGHASMPLSAHSGYFHSKDALNLLFSVCINRESANRGEWRSAPAVSRFLRRKGAVIGRTLIAAAAWLLAVDLLARTTNYSAVSAWAGAGASALVAGLAALVALGWWADRRWPLEIGAGVDKSDIHGL